MQAKTALDDAEIAYEEIDLGQYPKLLTEVKQTTGRVTVPQVLHSMLRISTLCMPAHLLAYLPA